MLLQVRATWALSQAERFAGVPAPLQHVVHTGLAKEPDDRWQSAHEVARELRWVKRSEVQRIVGGATSKKRELAFMGWLDWSGHYSKCWRNGFDRVKRQSWDRRSMFPGGRITSAK